MTTKQSMDESFHLLLFSTNPSFIREAVAAGIHAIIVDCEQVGKERRQASADTEVNLNTVADLRRVRECTDAPVICRINGFGPGTAEEVEQVIAAGADEVLLPMAHAVEEVEAVLRRAAGRCGVGMLIETVAAVELAAEFSRLPLSRVYVGLNDLAIERRTPNIFTALADGTVERVREHFTGTPFGFGGLTLPEFGRPIPCRLFIAEMARLRCNFTFLRRSFHRDVKGRDLAVEVPRILATLPQARLRSFEAVRMDREELVRAIQAW